MQSFRLVEMIIVVSAIVANARAADDASECIGDDEIKAALEKSIPLIEASSATYLEKRKCFSCHHQAMPVLTLVKARQHGLAVDEPNLKAQVERTAKHLERGKDNYLKGKGQGGRSDTAGYALWALAAADYEPDETTGAVSEYLLQVDQEQRFWKTSSNRPPSEASQFTTTAVALYGLSRFVTEDQADRCQAKHELVREWLLQAKPDETEELVFLLHSLKNLGESSAEIERAIAATTQQLVDSQNDDGGWSQTEELESDAYATGSVLSTLHELAAVGVSDPMYRRGLRYLLDQQLDDGSWHVVSRSKPFQTYFESGFPHGKDQFISMSATCWATQSLLAAAPAGLERYDGRD